ncbi:DUF7681 family protein [Rhodococcus pyridinivorans]|uniref:Acb2/Tad1 domain-containing protein n=1 Tax=Rhodococcus pyridinivorans TaxID=103816 RepID=UPI003AAC957B
MPDHSTPASAADINNRFDFHPDTTAEKRGEHESIHEACKSLAHALDSRVPNGREKALALTHLEDAMMWANAGIDRTRPEEPAAPKRARKAATE